MSTTSMPVCRPGAIGTRRSATVAESTRAMRMATVSARSRSTQSRGRGPCYAPGCGHTGASRRRSCRCISVSSSSCTTPGAEAKLSLAPSSPLWSCDVPPSPRNSIRAKGDFRWRRPRHTLKGRQDAEAVDRAGLRRKLFKAQAEAGDIVLLFGDESEALTHPYLAHAWAKKGADLRVPAPGQAVKMAMLGVLDWATRELLVHTSRTKRSSDFIDLLSELGRRYGPRPGMISTPVVLVLDNGPIHTSKASRAALAARAHWLTVEWLPKYAPELNDIEDVWRDVKRHHLAHQTFASADDLDRGIHQAVADLNQKRMHHPLNRQQRSA